MKMTGALVISLVILFTSCKEKKKNDFFPVLSYLQSQVKHIDTSLYGIIKVVTIDTISDTFNIRREEFRKEAAEFIDIPDLTSGKVSGQYTESKSYDESINRAVFSYYPKKNNAEVRRQEVTITPGFGDEDKIRNVYIEKIKEEKGKTITKRMNWIVDESFVIINIIQENGKPDKIEKTELIWNRPQEPVL